MTKWELGVFREKLIIRHSSLFIVFPLVSRVILWYNKEIDIHL
jgi:hypothetical protein